MITKTPPVRTGELALQGARIFHETRGEGPALLLIPTGNGDAGTYTAVAGLLARWFTVVTYDRRGFSRSIAVEPIDDARRLEGEADDAAALIEHLAGGRADVFGTCTGATIALELLARRPDTVRRLVAHEPPLVSVLPDAAEQIAFHEHVYATYRRSGMEAAIELFKDYLGPQSGNRPPDAFQPPPAELGELLRRIRGSRTFWMEHDMRAFPAVVPCLDALRAAADRLVLAGGVASRDVAGYRANAVLAGLLGTGLVEFPGGHSSHVTHPVEFAERLAGLLATGTG